MQYVKFSLGEFRYVLPLSEVVEIIPYVKLATDENFPAYIAGLCNYRGDSTPVIDLCSLLVKKSCRKNLSTRIIIVEMKGKDASNKLFGLIVEKATEIIKAEEESFVDASVYGTVLPYAGKVLADNTGLMSRMLPGDVLSQIGSEELFTATINTA